MTRAALNIGAVRAEVGNLEDLAPRWDELYPDERTDFEIDWSEGMARLRSVERMRDAGELSDEEEREYGAVRARVVALLPTIRRLELAEPKVPLD